MLQIQKYFYFLLIFLFPPIRNEINSEKGKQLNIAYSIVYFVTFHRFHNSTQFTLTFIRMIITFCTTISNMQYFPVNTAIEYNQIDGTKCIYI